MNVQSQVEALLRLSMIRKWFGSKSIIEYTFFGVMILGKVLCGLEIPSLGNTYRNIPDSSCFRPKRYATEHNFPHISRQDVRKLPFYVGTCSIIAVVYNCYWNVCVHHSVHLRSHPHDSLLPDTAIP